MKKEKFMSPEKIRKIIIASIYITMFTAIIVSCETNRGMMQGNGSVNMNSWNWGQILIGLGIGFLLCYLIIRKKR
jgi:hypothetical protein